jgi:acyl-CoA synthetase (AMP-forming)/AMP-acid ligase II
MFTRYVGDEQKTAGAFESGWFKTGDRARLGEDGSLMLLGRVQSLFPTPGGSVADLAVLARQITSVLGPADVAYHHADEGVYLYVAVHPEGIPHHLLIDGDVLEPIPAADPRAQAVHTQLTSFPAHRSIVAVAVFRGGFRLRTGEVGPTGKPRGWRIHQLHSARACPLWDEASAAIA